MVNRDEVQPRRKVVTENPVNEETPLAALQSSETPTDLFYVRNHFPIPQIQGDSWQVEIEGLSAGVRRFSLAEIKGLPTKTISMIMECAGNARNSMTPNPPGTPWGIGALSLGSFTGTPLSNLIPAHELPVNAQELIFSGADVGEVGTGREISYARSLRVDQALHPDTLLAWEMNGEPLPPAHGYPLRLVVPNWYGMASVKWLNKIAISAVPFKGFFQDEHYVYYDGDDIPDGTPVSRQRVRSLILAPADGAVCRSGEIEISGIAWSGAGEIKTVELKIGNSEWHPAHLSPPDRPYGAQRWKKNWQTEKSGDYLITVRASDTQGKIQPLKPVWNKLGYGNNVVHSVKIRIQS